MDEHDAGLSPLPPLGAHVSIAGGVAEAPGRARLIGATTFQLFLGSSNRWFSKAISEEEAGRFREEVAREGFTAPVAHSCYLINLASPEAKTGEMSVAALEEELTRAGQLGVAGVVIHPGAHMGEGEAAGLGRIAGRINAIFDKLPDNPTPILLETTAGQGTCLGWRFEHLAELIERTEDKRRIGVCLDTCHVFAAGYELRTATGVAETLRRFDETIGLGRLRTIHANDSKTPFNAHRDRHEHIGRGSLGEGAFAALLRDPRLRAVPFILETPKDRDPEDDRMNLETLRRLARGGAE